MHRTPLRSLLVAVLVAAPLLAACGDDDTTEPPTSSGSDGGAAATLTVHALDALEFDEASYEAEAGELDISYVNDGAIAHTLLIKDVDGFKLAVNASGDEDDDTVDLEPGEYTLYCDIAGHEAAGMVADLTVS